MIDLVGNARSVWWNFFLNVCEVGMFCDTGAQVSLIPVKQLSELFEASLNLTAVNDPLLWMGGSNTEINPVKQ